MGIENGQDVMVWFGAFLDGGLVVPGHPCLGAGLDSCWVLEQCREVLERVGPGQLGGVDEAHEIVKSLTLKSYEGGYKVMIIWMAEKMNIACANKLLKLIEEPPEKTLFILIAEDEEQIISTIKSRCQILRFPPLAEDDIKNALIKKFSLDVNVATKIAHQANGNFNKAE